MQGKRNIINTGWTEELAYAIGLIATDGNLSPDLRHINLTSKDKDIMLLFRRSLRLKNKVGRKARGGSRDKRYYVFQFGSVQFYSFLISIGLMPAKSKKLNTILIPKTYFWDFLRGCLDGDGNINEYIHPESRHPQLRIRFSSASLPFLNWKLDVIRTLTHIRGGWLSSVPQKSTYTLTFGKSDSKRILKKIYNTGGTLFLKRKFNIAKKYLLH